MSVQFFLPIELAVTEPLCLKVVFEPKLLIVCFIIFHFLPYLEVNLIFALLAVLSTL